MSEITVELRLVIKIPSCVKPRAWILLINAVGRGAGLDKGTEILYLLIDCSFTYPISGSPTPFLRALSFQPRALSL